MRNKLLKIETGFALLAAALGAQAWTGSDTAWETAYLVAHTADWGQTLDISTRCDSGAYLEANMVLGSCPSAQKVNAYFFSTALLHYGVAKLLSDKNRRMFQAGTLAMEIGAVSVNAKVGIIVKF